MPVVEATWKSSADGVTWMAQPPVSFPAAMAPSPPATTAAIRAKGSDLSLYVDSRSDGSLCHGEQTQIFVANRGPKPLHVRVLNLDSKGNVLVLFPNDQRAVDIIAPGESMALGDEPFTVTGAVGERERYVVLAAENPKGLGRFQRVAPTSSACRFRDDEARRLQNGIGLDAPQVAESGFTILDEPVCRDRPTKTQEEIGLEQIPWCPER